MSHFEYVIVLVSLVLGLSITKLLTGVGEMLQARAYAKQYWVHNVWVANVFLGTLMVWWVGYRWIAWEEQHQWSFFLFVFILLLPIVQFLLAVLLFPEEIPQGHDMKDHFATIQRPFFLLFAAQPLIDIGDSLLKGIDHFVSLGAFYLPPLLIATALSVFAAFTRRRHFHGAFGIFTLLVTLAFIVTNLRTLTSGSSNP